MILEVNDIHVYYGESYILQGVSLVVGAEEIVCLLGRNGAGKTTTMRSIVGYNPPRRGTVRYCGKRIDGRPVYENVRSGIGYVPEDRRIFPDLSVQENLEVAALLPREGREPWTVERLFDTFPLLARLRHRKGGNLSGGEQQMLAIARALAGNPNLLLLDEPCEGLAPVIVESLDETIRALKREMPILLTEQNARFALSLSDRGYVIDKGRVFFQGSAEELLENQEVQQRYLAV
ncbi:amino acid/amide ABC transporter ATP-binding protein 2, HAAT family (TC 3.A.1.4.-) [Desulfacinum hydrothermale DSM 13146]|uniref:Amino acid/amide ABC transporter ATP-binding protein 2, HAAT family (TC 3.A.1.4.-) n=1 Tax=Desulfacinum hydrothermale DSM 13146 TaxID=1121390 RepID=A0A1W1XBW1_9BACT|nr:ABC transporter ATP-binding protein [Desulfacinum hydrothermale]SMC21330.1 amino acid/amide ABC transporter ATP-binding protein 2, HAAT family (TC 3.A.1.4.-) [Desulfacinum hydrothermale DSM 13146]